MKISGYTYVRNGVELDYPFVESIKSVLSVCDEFIVVLGDSHDASREAILSINSDKVKIVDSVWDMNLRVDGGVFAQQSNIGLDHCTGDWVLHIQADEVVHENDVNRIKNNIYEYDATPEVQGLLFPYYHFWGGYNYIRTTRRVHRYEIRAFRNIKEVRSYHDSQGFRIYPTDKKGSKGVKLKVKKIDVPIYHYKRVRPPAEMKKKMNAFFHFYKDDKWMETYKNKTDEYDYQNIDILEEFKSTHPNVMHEKIAKQNWKFVYDKSKSKMPFKHKLLHYFEKLTGYRLFEYKNYKLLK